MGVVFVHAPGRVIDSVQQLDSICLSVYSKMKLQKLLWPWTRARKWTAWYDQWFSDATNSTLRITNITRWHVKDMRKILWNTFVFLQRNDEYVFEDMTNVCLWNVLIGPKYRAYSTKCVFAACWHYYQKSSQRLHLIWNSIFRLLDIFINSINIWNLYNIYIVSNYASGMYGLLICMATKPAHIHIQHHKQPPATEWSIWHTHNKMK